MWGEKKGDMEDGFRGVEEKKSLTLRRGEGGKVKKLTKRGP